MLRRKVPGSARQLPEWASLCLAGAIVTLVSWCLLDAASIVLNKHRHQWQQQHASLRRQVLQGPLPQAAIKAARFKPTSPQTAATTTSWQAGSWADHQVTPQQLSISDASSLSRFPYLHDERYRIYSHSAADTSARCVSSGICDWVHEPGADGLGNITKPADRLQKVREATQWAWKGYTRYAWGLDELDPNSKTGRDWFGVGLTIVDSVDTLLIQGLWEEAAEAREWIAHHLQLRGRSMSVFESIIRILGGLLSAFYHSGGDEMYLVKALEFADRLLPVFSTQSGVHVGTFTLGDQVVHGRSPGGMLWVGPSNLAEAGTTSLEFSTLSHMTGIPIYRQQSMRFWYDAQSKLDTLDGLFCTDLDGDSLACRQHYFTMGPSADSTYEYMLKQWILSAGQDTVCLDLYRAAMRGLRKHMVVRVRTEEEAQRGGEGHLMLATLTAHRAQQGLQVSSRHVQVEHLSCFVPGMLALGHLYGQRTSKHDAPGDGRQPQHTATTRRLTAAQQSSRARPGDQEDDDLLLAARLMRGCYDLYTRARSGLAFDSARFDVAWRPVPDGPSLPPGPPTPASAEQPSDIATSTTAQRQAHGATRSLEATRHQARAAGGRIGSSDSAALSPGSLARDNPDSHALQGSSARRLQAWSQQAQAGALSALHAAWPVAKQRTATAGSSAWAAVKRAVGMGWTAALSLAAAPEPNQAPAYGTLPASMSDTGISGPAPEHVQAYVTEVNGAPAGQASTARTAQSAAAAQPDSMQQQHAAATGTLGRHLLARAQHQRPQQGARPGGSQAGDDLDDQVFQFQPLTHANFLRPEVVESLFYLYRATGDPVYQEWGWNIFRAYERWCRVEQGGYITMMNVDAVPPVADYNGKMESFWLAETLKYFYLLFSEPDVIPLDVYVFNTEAHPLPIWGSEPDRTMLQRLSPALRGRLQSTQALYDNHMQQHRLQQADKMRGGRQHPHS